MTEAAVLNATARVRQLTDLTARLTERLVAESRAFESHRPQDAAASVQDTQDLANLYRRESAQVKANPSILSAAPSSERIRLVKATERFNTVLTKHSVAVEAARIISEGLVQTIAAEVAGRRGAPSAYGSSGRANQGDSRAVAFNRTA